MLRSFTIAALAAVLIASGAFSPQAQVKSTSRFNLTVIEKNQPWPLPGMTIDICNLSQCQDV